MTKLGKLTFAFVLLSLAPARADVAPPAGCEEQCDPAQVAKPGTTCKYCDTTMMWIDAGVFVYPDGGYPRCPSPPDPPFTYVCSHWGVSLEGWREVWCDGPVDESKTSCEKSSGCLVSGGAARAR